MVIRKTTALALGFVLTLTAGAFAQDYIFTNFTASRDYRVTPAPCTLLGSAQPVVYDTSIWLLYTCTDNTVIARRFFHPNDQAALTRVVPVRIIEPDPVTPSPYCQTVKPGPNWRCVDGGWLPPL